MFDFKYDSYLISAQKDKYIFWLFLKAYLTSWIFYFVFVHETYVVTVQLHD